MRKRVNPRKGRFYRPELETGWQRFSRNLAVRITAGALLLGSATTLTVVAIQRLP